MLSKGDKLICINKDPIPPFSILNCNLLDKGAEYTLAYAKPSQYYLGVLLLFLEEVPGIGFHHWRFRRVVKDQLEVLRELIVDPSEKVKDPVAQLERALDF